MKKVKKIKGEENMEKDRLHDCYIWHIITLAKMKYKLKQLKGGK
jgi:hypothetical protein